MNDQAPELLTADPFESATLAEGSGPITDEYLCEIIDNHAGHLLERGEVEALACELLFTRERARSVVRRLWNSRHRWMWEAEGHRRHRDSMEQLADRHFESFLDARAELEEAVRVAEWFAAERDYVARTRAQEWAAIAQKQRRDRARTAEAVTFVKAHASWDLASRFEAIMEGRNA